MWGFFNLYIIFWLYILLKLLYEIIIAVVNNIINIKASDLKKWADNVQITGLGDTGSVTFNIKYDVAQEFTKPHFTINGTGTGGYDVTGGRILLNFGTQQGEITFGELYSGTILFPYPFFNSSICSSTLYSSIYCLTCFKLDLIPFPSPTVLFPCCL